MGYVNFNNVNPYKLEFVEPGLFYKHNDKWICLATNCKMDPMPYITFKPAKEEKTDGIQD